MHSSSRAAGVSVSWCDTSGRIALFVHVWLCLGTKLTLLVRERSRSWLNPTLTSDGKHEAKWSCRLWHSPQHLFTTKCFLSVLIVIHILISNYKNGGTVFQHILAQFLTVCNKPSPWVGGGKLDLISHFRSLYGQFDTFLTVWKRTVGMHCKWNEFKLAVSTFYRLLRAYRGQVFDIRATLGGVSMRFLLGLLKQQRVLHLQQLNLTTRRCRPDSFDNLPWKYDWKCFPVLQNNYKCAWSILSYKQTERSGHTHTHRSFTLIEPSRVCRVEELHHV